MDSTCDECIGGLTFGIYHHYVSMIKIELNDKKIETLCKKFRIKSKSNLRIMNVCIKRFMHQ